MLRTTYARLEADRGFASRPHRRLAPSARSSSPAPSHFWPRDSPPKSPRSCEPRVLPGMAKSGWEKMGDGKKMGRRSAWSSTDFNDVVRFFLLWCWPHGLLRSTRSLYWWCGQRYSNSCHDVPVGSVPKIAGFWVVEIGAIGWPCPTNINKQGRYPQRSMPNKICTTARYLTNMIYCFDLFWCTSTYSLINHDKPKKNDHGSGSRIDVDLCPFGCPFQWPLQAISQCRFMECF